MWSACGSKQSEREGFRGCRQTLGVVTIIKRRSRLIWVCGLAHRPNPTNSTLSLHYVYTSRRFITVAAAKSVAIFLSSIPEEPNVQLPSSDKGLGDFEMYY